MILCANPQAQYAERSEEIDAAIARVLRSGWYVLGKEVEAFEAEFAEFVGARHAIGVGSGTDALRLALASLGIGPGDEVITVSHTAVATVAAIDMIGARPVLADIEPTGFAIDPSRVESLIGPLTKAIVPVHLYGRPADLSAIQAVADRHRLPIIEDCAQSHGAQYEGRRVGSVGTLGCFSFYPTKNLGALGDGGLIVTNDESIASRLKRIRQYGWGERYASREPGINSRLDEVQAAVLRVKLRYLDADNERRRELAHGYAEGLRGTPLLLPEAGSRFSHVYHLYVVRSDRRDELREHLLKDGIQALVHYPVPIHLQEGYRDRVRIGSALPRTERAAQEVLSLPLYPQLTRASQQEVIGSILRFLDPAGGHATSGRPAARARGR